MVNANENANGEPPIKPARKFRRRTPEEVLEQFKQFRTIERYRKGEKLEKLSAELGMHPATLWRWFVRLGVKPEKEDTLKIFADKKMEAQNEIAIKQADLAISLGLTIVERYYPYIDYLLAQGKTPEGIVEEMVDLYQRKREIERKIAELEAENERLKADLEDLKYYATPQIKEEIKAKIHATKVNALQQYVEKVNRLKLYCQIAGVEFEPLLDFYEFWQILKSLDRISTSLDKMNAEEILKVRNEWLKP